MDWLTVEQLQTDQDGTVGRACVLANPADATTAIADTSWSGRSLGAFSTSADGAFESGLITTDDGIELEFFAHARTPSGAAAPLIEIALPFLWYWDAFPVNDGWNYLTASGHRRDLVRYATGGDEWKVEVRALEFRKYLAATGRAAVMQVDIGRRVADNSFEPVYDVYQDDTFHFEFGARGDHTPDRSGASHTIGQYVIVGQGGPTVPKFEEFDRAHEYPEFLYGIDPNTHEELRHTCDPSALGTYFDKTSDRLHYLTPVYFTREVLQRYAAEPTKYRITSSHLSCLDLWGVDISFNTAGLVEVYLGDLGAKVPSEEHGNWLAHNVRPEGHMEEGRYKRDFLGQWVDSPDVTGDLRRARKRASEVSEALLGTPLWRPLTGETLAEFESMIDPLNDDPTALGKSLLLLPVTLIDAINPKPLKDFLGDAQPNERSLSLLQRFTETLGDQDNITAILRQLWDFRSQGGTAHLAGSQATTARRNLGILGLRNLTAFESVAVRITKFFDDLVQLMEERLEIQLKEEGQMNEQEKSE